MMTPSCILHRMSWPKPVEALWRELEAARGELLREVEGLSQRQSEWRPAPSEWSIGEVVDHLAIAEVATGKLTTKLTKEAAAGGATSGGRRVPRSAEHEGGAAHSPARGRGGRQPPRQGRPA